MLDDDNKGESSNSSIEILVNLYPIPISMGNTN